MTTRAKRPPTYPKAQPFPDNLPNSSLDPSSGSMELVKMVANSIPIRPMTKKSMITEMLKSPGADHHNPSEPTTYITENSHIHLSLWPKLSARVPRIGAMTAITIPALATQKAQTVCAFAPSPISDLT